MYTNNTSICFSSGAVGDLNRAINADLEDLKIWLESNKQELNVVKTQGISIGKSKRLQKPKKETSTKSSFQIENNEVTLVDDTKYLGACHMSKNGPAN